MFIGYSCDAYLVQLLCLLGTAVVLLGTDVVLLGTAGVLIGYSCGAYWVQLWCLLGTAVLLAPAPLQYKTFTVRFTVSIVQRTADCLSAPFSLFLHVVLQTFSPFCSALQLVYNLSSGWSFEFSQPQQPCG
jgi:hypothetical protein